MNKIFYGDSRTVLKNVNFKARTCVTSPPYFGVRNYGDKPNQIGIEKTVDCERIGMAVVGLEVPHVHIHLIPINSMNDMNFSNSLDLKKQDFEDLSNKIKNNI